MVYNFGHLGADVTTGRTGELDTFHSTLLPTPTENGILVIPALSPALPLSSHLLSCRSRLECHAPHAKRTLQCELGPTSRLGHLRVGCCMSRKVERVSQSNFLLRTVHEVGPAGPPSVTGACSASSGAFGPPLSFCRGSTMTGRLSSITTSDAIYSRQP